MSFISGLFRTGSKPQNRTSGSSYSFLFGGSTSGKAVNERSSMQMTAVYACVRILAEAIAGLPLHLYRHGENSSKQKAKEHPLYSLLHAEPNVEMTSFVFRENGDVSGDVSGGVSGGVSSDVDYSDTHLSKNAMRVYQMDRGVYWSSRLQECSDIWIPILSILWQSP